MVQLQEHNPAIEIGTIEAPSIHGQIINRKQHMPRDMFKVYLFNASLGGGEASEDQSVFCVVLRQTVGQQTPTAMNKSANLRQLPE